MMWATIGMFWSTTDSSLGMGRGFGSAEVRTEERLAPNLLENLITWYRFVPNLNKLKQTLLLTVHICINPELEIATTT